MAPRRSSSPPSRPSGRKSSRSRSSSPTASRRRASAPKKRPRRCRRPRRIRRCSGRCSAEKLVAVAATGLIGISLALALVAVISFANLTPRWMHEGPTQPVVTTQIASGLYDISSTKPVFFVRGRVENRGTRAVGPVRVVADLLGDSGAVARAETVAGTEPSAEDLHALRSVADADAMAKTLARAGADKKLGPGESMPFFALISDPPTQLTTQQYRGCGSETKEARRLRRAIVGIQIVGVPIVGVPTIDTANIGIPTILRSCLLRAVDLRYDRQRGCRAIFPAALLSFGDPEMRARRAAEVLSEPLGRRKGSCCWRVWRGGRTGAPIPARPRSRERCAGAAST